MLDELHSNVLASIHEQQRRSAIDPGGSLFFLRDIMMKRNIKLADNLEEIVQNTIKISKTLYPEQYHAMTKQYAWC